MKVGAYLSAGIIFVVALSCARRDFPKTARPTPATVQYFATVHLSPKSSTAPFDLHAPYTEWVFGWPDGVLPRESIGNFKMQSGPFRDEEKGNLPTHWLRPVAYADDRGRHVLVWLERPLERVSSPDKRRWDRAVTPIGRESWGQAWDDTEFRQVDQKLALSSISTAEKSYVVRGAILVREYLLRIEVWGNDDSVADVALTISAELRAYIEQKPE